MGVPVMKLRGQGNQPSAHGFEMDSQQRNPRFPGCGFHFGPEERDCRPEEGRAQNPYGYGGAVKHIYKKKLKVHLAVGYDFKLLVHGISSLSDSIRPRGRACKVKSKFVMV